MHDNQIQKNGTKIADASEAVIIYFQSILVKTKNEQESCLSSGVHLVVRPEGCFLTTRRSRALASCSDKGMKSSAQGTVNAKSLVSFAGACCMGGTYKGGETWAGGQHGTGTKGHLACLGVCPWLHTTKAKSARHTDFCG